MAKKSIETESKVCETGVCKESLKKLLMAKMPGTFDREPASSFNGNLDKLVDEIITLKCK